MDLVAGRAEAQFSIFLSSAAADSEWDAVIRERLTRLGYDVIGAPPGGAADQLEQRVAGATAFLALLSDDYFGSPACLAEAAAAITHEEYLRAAKPPSAFIHVLEVARTWAPEATAFSIYAHLSAAGTVGLDATLDELSRRLRLVSDRRQPGPSASVGGEHEPPEFRNRREELDKVVNGLTDSGGPHFWLVVAPPQLGKTRFLGQVFTELQLKSSREASGQAWDHRPVDLAQHPDARHDPGVLLARMFGLSAPVPDDPEALRGLARDIRRTNRSVLCTLDGAELLDAQSAERLRAALSKLREHIRNGRLTTRFGLVAASRSIIDTWRGVLPSPRVAELQLTGFTAEIVDQAVREFARECDCGEGQETLARYAESVHKLSEGLPGLLTRCLHWMRDEDWLDMERLDSQELFEELARPYIMADLLSAQSLFGRNGGASGPPADASGFPRLALEHAFRRLAPYRFFTLSHLSKCLESDSSFAAVVEQAGWSVQDLLEAICDTALLEQVPEPWQELHAAIRRLLYRYYFRSDEQRLAAHREAMEFVQVWSGTQPGREQVDGLIEALWHQAVVLSLTAPGELASGLIESARKLALKIADSSTFTAFEWRRYAVQRMREDGELQEATSSIPGLFEQLIAIVAAVPEP